MISRRGMEEELDMQEQKDPSMNIEEQWEQVHLFIHLISKLCDATQPGYIHYY